MDNECNNTVDVAILTYKPDERFVRLIKLLQRQSVRLKRIIVINTEEELFYPPDYQHPEPGEKEPFPEVHHISKNDFNHGDSRNFAAGFSKADYLLFMTQDAVPRDYKLIEELLKPMESGTVAVSYARQIPSVKSGKMEWYNRSFNYPEGDCLKTKKDLPKLGIKTFFCSNACALYRRDVFDEIGGFVRTDFNEDMIFAHSAIEKGYGIYYASNALVTHSHDYTLLQQFTRNIAIGVSQGLHPEVFKGVKSEGEGARLVKGSFSYFLKADKPSLIPLFMVHCAARYAGFIIGKCYGTLAYMLNRFSDKQ